MRLSKKLYRCFEKTYGHVYKDPVIINDMVTLAEQVDNRKFEIDQEFPELKEYYDIASNHKKYEYEKVYYEVIEKYLRVPIALTASGVPLNKVKSYDNFFKSFLKSQNSFDQGVLNSQELELILEIAHKVFIKTYPKLECPI